VSTQAKSPPAASPARGARRFTKSGNDMATRDCASILWVATPEETDFFLKLLLADLRRLRAQPYIE